MSIKMLKVYAMKILELQDKISQQVGSCYKINFAKTHMLSSSGFLIFNATDSICSSGNFNINSEAETWFESGFYFQPTVWVAKKSDEERKVFIRLDQGKGAGNGSPINEQIIWNN